jgi:hypothetical protein
VRLREEGYEISVHGERFLLVHHIPYVKADRTVAYGVLVLELTIAGDEAVKPGTHIAHWMGEHPCDATGATIQKIRHGGVTQHTPGLRTDHSFSNKPKTYWNDGYPDDYTRSLNYIEHIIGPARAIDPSVTPKTGIVHPDCGEESVFHYAETASTRSGTIMLAERFTRQKIAIVGLGGTGAYALDFIAKTPVAEIHLFDGDRFLSHNAFRAPGAASLEELRAMPFKVDYYAVIYGKQRKGIHARAHHVTADNVQALAGMDYVFLCVDKPAAKGPIIAFLEGAGITFFDCGMGLVLNGAGVSGQLRTTTSTPGNRDQARANIGTTAAPDDDLYRSNIQVADLNALNALQAIIKWKKLTGFYPDLGGEHNVGYAVDTNTTSNEDCAA